MELTVIIPTHNPDAGRLQRTLAALRTQTLPASQWETLLVDNASTPALTPDAWQPHAPANLRLVTEARLGLSHARRRGFAEATGEILLLVDDDNVLAPDYLATVLALFTQYPIIGALGGRSLPEFAVAPPAWLPEFHSLLALRDLGPEPFISQGLRPAGATHNVYPEFAPIGAGMALRRAAITSWLQADSSAALPDRRGQELTSGGDNDIVLVLLHAGWEVCYHPALSLTHLIPAGRLDPAYLARLNEGIQKSWMQVLTRHGANPWSPLTASGAALRKVKAWFAHRPWTSPVARIRWRGVCGHFAGRVPLSPGRP